MGNNKEELEDLIVVASDMAESLQVAKILLGHVKDDKANRMIISKYFYSIIYQEGDSVLCKLARSEREVVHFEDNLKRKKCPWYLSSRIINAYGKRTVCSAGKAIP